MKARYYDGTRGQFLSQDPSTRDNPDTLLEDPQQLNYYAYARGNPLRLVDPTGEGIWDVVRGYAVGVVTRPVDYAKGVWAAGEKYSNTNLGPAGGVLIRGRYGIRVIYFTRERVVIK